MTECPGCEMEIYVQPGLELGPSGLCWVCENTALTAEVERLRGREQELLLGNTHALSEVERLRVKWALAEEEAAEAKHTAEQRGAERDEWRKKWEDLESHRGACCWAMEEERDAALAQLAEERVESNRVGQAYSKLLDEHEKMQTQLAEAQATAQIMSKAHLEMENTIKELHNLLAAEKARADSLGASLAVLLPGHGHESLRARFDEQPEAHGMMVPIVLRAVDARVLLREFAAERDARERAEAALANAKKSAAEDTGEKPKKKGSRK